MRYEEAKREFIQTWGKLGSEWGINRTMAQVHALLLISPKPLSTEEVMEELNISRGNANMNLRDLINWNLISKELIPGERKEYFKAEKDIWEIAKRITEERKRREIEPVKKTLEQLKSVEGEKGSKEVAEFTKVIKDLNDFVNKMDKSMDLMLKADQNWFFGNILKLIK
jgi:DNA-binding transcriptional regulator GbsR (MarR family)